jgi:hypothetical protein
VFDCFENLVHIELIRILILKDEKNHCLFRMLVGCIDGSGSANGLDGKTIR